MANAERMPAWPRRDTQIAAPVVVGGTTIPHSARMRRYRYVGPQELAVEPGPPGTVIASTADLAAWLRTNDNAATFVVGLDGALRIADRHSEHVSCAGEREVLAAGEMFFADGRVARVSNQSSGFCPAPASWPAVAAALDRAGIAHPGRYTDAFEFRRCNACGQRNIVKDDDFTCAICGGELPAAWNFTL
jgi:hypothetical protein